MEGRTCHQHSRLEQHHLLRAPLEYQCRPDQWEAYLTGVLGSVHLEYNKLDVPVPSRPDNDSL